MGHHPSPSPRDPRGPANQDALSQWLATIVYLPASIRFQDDHVTQAEPIKIFLIFDLWTQKDRGSSFPTGSHKDTILGTLVFPISFLEINPLEREKKNAPTISYMSVPANEKLPMNTESKGEGTSIGTREKQC